MKIKVLAGLLLMASGLMVLTSTDALAQSGVDDPGEVAAGMTVFNTSCAGCHGADGLGTNRGRPLTNIASQGDRATHFTSVSEGKGSMPAFGDRLTVDEIDAALSYARLTFVTTAEEDAAAVRAEAEAALAAARAEAEAARAAAAEFAAEQAAAAAEETSAETELAVTGVETPLLAAGGLTLVLAGALMVRTSRRFD